MDNFLTGSGLGMVVYGFVSLVGIWLVPAIGRSRFDGSGMLPASMEPTRINRTIMALWSLLFGACMASLSSGHRALGNVFLLVLSLCTLAALFIRYRHRR